MILRALFMKCSIQILDLIKLILTVIQLTIMLGGKNYASHWHT
jgi:hypothetical protein